MSKKTRATMALLSATCEEIAAVVDPELTGQDTEVVEGGIPVDDTTDTDVAAVVEEASEGEDMADAVDEFQDVEVELQHLRDQAASVLASGHYTAAYHNSITNHADSLIKRVGLVGSHAPSMEGITDPEAIAARAEATLEGFGESIKNAGKAAWNVLKELINKVLNFFLGCRTSAESLKKRANAMVIAAQAMKADPSGEIGSARLFGILTTDGETVKPVEAVKVTLQNYKAGVARAAEVIKKLGGTADVEAVEFDPVQANGTAGGKNLDVKIKALTRNEIQTVGRAVTDFADVVLRDDISKAVKALGDQLDKLANAAKPKDDDGSAEKARNNTTRDRANTALRYVMDSGKQATKVMLAAVKVGEMSLESKAAKAD